MSAASVLATDAPHIGIDEAAALLQTQYGLEGELTALPSERDHNFRVRTPDRGDFVLKITHPDEPREVTNFQTMALRHIAAVDPGLAVPAVIPTRDGQFEWDLEAQARTVRLLTYLPGQILLQAPRSRAQDRALGAFLARVGRALRGFFHPAADANDILWDLRQLPRVKSFVSDIVDPGRRALVARVIDDAEDRALPVLPKLRAQVVHNDLNPSNVVVDEAAPDRVAGILDFGDMLHGPLICDVAVGASYRWTTGGDPIAGVARFIAGYHAVTQLEHEEVAVLLDLIRARLALTLAVVNWQALRFPEKREYVLRMNAELWTFLEALSDVSRAKAEAAFRASFDRAKGR